MKNKLITKKEELINDIKEFLKNPILGRDSEIGEKSGFLKCINWVLNMIEEENQISNRHIKWNYKELEKLFPNDNKKEML